MNVVTAKKEQKLNDKSIFLYYKIISIVDLRENKRERYYYGLL